MEYLHISKSNLSKRIVNSIVLWSVVVLVIAGIVSVKEGSISVSSSVNGRELPVYCVDTDKKELSISFDASWGDENTQKILDILAEHHVHATFFVTGTWVENYPEDVKKIYEAGHDIGNHSENHKNMSELSDEEIKEELTSVGDAVKKLTGYQMTLFRPPYGDYDDKVITVAKELGYMPIQWDVDSLDWKEYGVDDIINTVCNHPHLGNGSIILCHNAGKYTAEALDQLLTNLEDQGYTIVPISQLIYTDNYYMDVEGRQHQNE